MDNPQSLWTATFAVDWDLGHSGFLCVNISYWFRKQSLHLSSAWMRIAVPACGLPCRMCLCLKHWHGKGQSNFSCDVFSCFYPCNLQCCLSVWKGYLRRRSLVFNRMCLVSFSSYCMVSYLKLVVCSWGFPLLICKDKCFFLHHWYIKGQMHFSTLTLTMWCKSFVLINPLLPLLKTGLLSDNVWHVCERLH